MFSPMAVELIKKSFVGVRISDKFGPLTQTIFILFYILTQLFLPKKSPHEFFALALCLCISAIGNWLIKRAGEKKKRCQIQLSS